MTLNKKNIIGLVVAIGLLAALFLVSSGSPKAPEVVVSNQSAVSNQNSSKPQTAEKIEVVHFHGTQQCISCITVGKFALETITKRFPKEYANGTITFKDINGELPENRDMVIKYKATGSSLFVNAITDGVNNITEDTTVWLKISNEQDFLNYFENKLNNLLGK